MVNAKLVIDYRLLDVCTRLTVATSSHSPRPVSSPLTFPRSSPVLSCPLRMFVLLSFLTCKHHAHPLGLDVARRDLT
eukprot:758925-Hanusia_phi.AAC.1